MSSQVVYQLRHLPNLALDDVAGLLDDWVVRPHLPKDVQGIENRREGAAQFMGQQSHESFLAAIGIGQTICPQALSLHRLALG